MKKNYQDPLEVIGRAKGYSREEIILNLPRHANFSPNLLNQVERLPEVLLRNSGSLAAKKFIRMMREVFSEIYRAKQFTRTEITNRGVLFGIVLLKHKVIDLVLNYFHERWPQCIICLYNEFIGKTGIIDEKGNIWESKLSLEKVVKEVSKDRPIIAYFDDIQFSGRKIFETLYSTQSITERENLRYFKSMIPEKCYQLPGLRQGVEKDYLEKGNLSRIKKLNEFL